MLSALHGPLQLAQVSLALTTGLLSAASPDERMALYGIAGTTRLAVDYHTALVV
jgi:hypothetical protein